MAWYRCSSGGGTLTGFLPNLPTDTAFRMQQLNTSTVPTITYEETLPTTSDSGWGRMGASSSWVAIANVKNKSQVIRTGSSNAPNCFGITVNGNTYTLTSIAFSSNIADCSAYDYVLVQSTNASAIIKIYFN